MAQIQIWTRDVKSTQYFGKFTPQHTFLIKVNDDGSREILRGGPIEDNMLLGDSEIINQPYNWDGINPENHPLDWFDPTSGSNILNYQGQTIKISTQSEIDNLWNNAKSLAKIINAQSYDYEPLSQNCNTATATLAHAMGLEDEFKNFLLQKKLFAPGSDGIFKQDVTDRAWNSFENAMEHGVKGYLNSLITDSQTIADSVQDYFDLLFAAEGARQTRRADPLSLDLDGDGIELCGTEDSTAFFDLDMVEVANGTIADSSKGEVLYYDEINNKTYIGDGLKEQVGWVESDDGILTLDRNGNGVIDNIIELFGKSNKTGTEELTEFDLNADGVINKDDAIFNKLKLWQDGNQDGISQADELKALDDYNITSIDVNTNNLETLNQTDNANLIISKGNFTTNVTNSNGTISEEKNHYYNLDLAVNQSNSASYTYEDVNGNIVGDYDLNLDVLSLPMSRGYGNVEALPIAMSKNEDLLNAVKELVNISSNDYKKPVC